MGGASLGRLYPYTAAAATMASAAEAAAAAPIAPANGLGAALSPRTFSYSDHVLSPSASLYRAKPHQHAKLQQHSERLAAERKCS